MSEESKPEIKPGISGQVPYCDWRCPQYAADDLPCGILELDAMGDKVDEVVGEMCFPAVRRMAETIENIRTALAECRPETHEEREARFERQDHRITRSKCIELGKWKALLKAAKGGQP